MYKIEQSNKGRSVYAIEDIEKDCIIFEETPSIICEDVYDCIYKLNEIDYFSEFNDLQPSIIDKFMIDYKSIQEDIRTLPKYMQTFFNSFQSNELRLLVSKFQRNAFNYQNQHGGPSALLLKGNLFNHSCDPNISFHIDNNGKFIFKTNRKINKNEELFNKYIDINIPFKERQKLLLFQYGFKCLCEKCIKSR
jgi:hypothetical protein